MKEVTHTLNTSFSLITFNGVIFYAMTRSINNQCLTDTNIHMQRYRHMHTSIKTLVDEGKGIFIQQSHEHCTGTDKHIYPQ